MTTLTSHMQRPLHALAIAFFLLCAFFLFLMPITDGDFFWHVKTGEWIWQHKMLPQTDPFSPASSPASAHSQQTEAARFILQGYWLAQLLFFGIWKMFGPAGIIALRAAIYTGLVALVLIMTKKRSGFLAAGIMAFLLADLLREFPGERPQLFTFLFTPLTIYLLERLRTNRNARATGPKDLALPLLMLLWPNLHGGYVIGVVLILIYAFGAAVAFFQHKIRPPAGFIMLCGISLLATFLNPNTYHVFFMLMATASAQTGSLQEYLSPFTAALQLGEYYIPYFVFLLGTIALLLIKFKTMELTHILVIVFFGGLSLTGLRFMPYLLMTAPLAGRYFTMRETRYESILMILITIVWITAADKTDLAHTSLEPGFPAQAADFIRAERPEGVLFNYYGWGGYLIWFLPEYPVFIDGRGLDGQADSAYEAALWSEDWERVFRIRKVTIVLMPGMSPSSGEVYPLVLRLMQRDDWFLVYKDDWSIVFVQNVPGNRAIIHDRAIQKEFVYDQILAASNALIKKNPNNPGYWRTRATVQFYKGDFKNAAAGFRRVLELAPMDKRSLNALQSLDQGSLPRP